MSEQTVSLSVPAEPSYARCVRMMAANLAVVSGMSVDEVDDVRMACEEGFVFACSTGPQMCSVDFGVSKGSLSMSFSLGDESPQEDSDADDPLALSYADLLLQALCDEYRIDTNAGKLNLVMQSGGEDA